MFTFPVCHFGGQYVANAVDFDGANDYLTRGGNLTGLSDGKEFSLRFLFNPATLSSGTDYVLFETTNGRFSIRINGTTRRLAIQASNAAGTIVLLATPTPQFSASNWYDLMLDVDLTNASNRSVYINDAASAVTWSTYTNDNIDFTDTDFAIGATPAGNLKYDGDLADVWFDDARLAFATEANRRKFISTTGKPVDLGATGATPTGASPILYLSKRLGESASDFATNKGTGGGMTITGTLIDSTTSPSD